MRPAGVEESMPSVPETKVMPRSVKLLDGLQDVDHVAAQPVEFPHHDRVALTDILHQRGQAGPVVTGAGHHIREHLGDPGGAESLVLLIEGLGDRRDAGVADPRARALSGAGCRITVSHNWSQHHYRDNYF